jgi:arginine exporter protein ArgO
LGLTEGGRSYATAAGLVAGVFCGSALWWLTLSTAVSLFRTRFTPAHLRWVNIVSGLIIAGFGLLALISLVA